MNDMTGVFNCCLRSSEESRSSAYRGVNAGDDNSGDLLFKSKLHFDASSSNFKKLDEEGD